MKQEFFVIWLLQFFFVVVRCLPQRNGILIDEDCNSNNGYSCGNEDQCLFDDQNSKVSICEAQEDPDDPFSDFVKYFCSLENGQTVSKRECRNGAGRCCHKDYIQGSAVALTTTTTTTTITTKTTIATTTTFKTPPTKQKCGTHSFIETSNKEAKDREFPYMCYIKRKDSNAFVCGGSLIAPGIILTAAHKLNDIDPDDIIVSCGIISQLEKETENDRQVSEILLHPGFEETNLKFNFGVLVLIKEFDLKLDFLNVICLPPNRSFNQFEQTQCITTGWGSEPDLQKEISPLLEFNECRSTLRSQMGSSFQLHRSFVCAGDTCDEEGGGSPLVCPLIEDRERFVQVGLVAWGLGCGKENVPSVYASVADGICFIKNAVECWSVNYNEYFEDIQNCNQWKASYKKEINLEIQKWTKAFKIGASERAEKQKEKYESILDNYNKIFGKCVDPRTAAIFPENDELQEEVDEYSY